MSVKVKDYLIQDENDHRVMITILLAQGEYARWLGYGWSSVFKMTEFEFKYLK